MFGHGRRQAKKSKVIQRSFIPQVESLEHRCLPSIGLKAGGNVDISRFSGNENEPAIAVDPSNPQHMFAFSNTDTTAATTGGLFGAYSFDGGLTWSGRVIGTGTDTGGDGLPSGCCDPQVAYDQFGDLFLTYLGNDLNPEIALSKDGGKTFSLLHSFSDSGTNDQPHLAVGPNSVWVSYFEGTSMAASGATIIGPGNIGTFTTPQTIPGSVNGNFGSIAVGPAGQVYLDWQNSLSGSGPQNISGSLNPTGVGGLFGGTFLIASTNVGSNYFIPAQSNNLGIPGAEAKMAWDRSGGIHNGRLYVVYSNVATIGSVQTDNYVRFSDDNGQTWSDPVRVSDNTGNNSKFFPTIAVDQTTGDVAVAWYDTRNDTGNGGPGDTDHIPNDDSQLWATFSLNGGQTFLPNIQVSSGTSNSNDSEPPGAGTRPLGFGDYMGSTYAFVDGVFHPIWSDNSNFTGANPDGKLSKLDLYTAPVQVASNQVPIIATGAPFGTAPLVNVYNSQTNQLKFSIMAYNSGFIGGVRVAVADVNGDGVPDIITAPGSGGAPMVRIFDGNTGAMISQFMAYDFFFQGGVFVAAGDVNNTGVPDIITGPDAGGGPMVRVFDTSGNMLNQFFAYSPNFYGGVHVATGDLTGNGVADIITGAGGGGGPHVEAFNPADDSLLQSFMAYNINFHGGVTVASGDINNSGRDDIITGAGFGGGPQVNIYDGTSGALVNTFMAGPQGASLFDENFAFRSGITVATTNTNANGFDQIVVGMGPGNGSLVKVFDPLSLGEVDQFFAASNTPFGVYVGGA
jgi:hypothetical protein